MPPEMTPANIQQTRAVLGDPRDPGDSTNPPIQRDLRCPETESNRRHEDFQSSLGRHGVHEGSKTSTNPHVTERQEAPCLHPDSTPRPIFDSTESKKLLPGGILVDHFSEEKIGSTSGIEDVGALGLARTLRDALSLATAEGRWGLVADLARHLAELEKEGGEEHLVVGDTTNRSKLTFIVGGKQLA